MTKLSLTLVSFLFLLTSVVQASALETVFAAPIPWDGSFAVQLLRPKNWNDPGDFTKIVITENKRKVFELNYLQAVKMSEQTQAPKGTTDLGPTLKMIPLDQEGKNSALAFADWGGGSNDDKLILLVPKDHSVKIAFRKSLRLSRISDFDGDGKFDLLYTGNRAEPVSPGVYSYDPYLVFRQSMKDGHIAFVLDQKLSKKWSEQNDYEWHGDKFNEKLLVDIHGKIIPPK